MASTLPYPSFSFFSSSPFPPNLLFFYFLSRRLLSPLSLIRVLRKENGIHPYLSSAPFFPFPPFTLSQGNSCFVWLHASFPMRSNFLSKMDGYHTAITSSFHLPSPLFSFPSLFPTSFFFSRTWGEGLNRGVLFNKVPFNSFLSFSLFSPLFLFLSFLYSSRPSHLRLSCL